jgi:AraC-like DNA-binding protein
VLSPRLFPSLTVRATLEGMGACGLTRDDIVGRSGIPAEALEERDGTVPLEVVERLWMAAFEAAPRETLPLEVGLRVPYGAFGLLDFLTATAEKVAGAFESLRAFFRSATFLSALEVQPQRDAVRVNIVNRVPFDTSAICDAFIAGVLLGRFRARSEGAFVASLELATPHPAEPEAFRRVAGTEVRFAQPSAALVIDRASYGLRLRDADARLHGTLRALAATLDLGDGVSDLARAVRARVRGMLADGGADAATVARWVGLSERTLRRRLRDEGLGFAAIVDEVRREEALRLLGEGRCSLAQIAMQVGFREQSSFNRAFRRWSGDSPRAVRARMARPA